ncbi:MAG: ATP-binding protein [Candidatus Bathyarchaeia archaeon]
MKFIGRVADGATETSARVILLKGLEREVVAEELVLIKNGGEDKPSSLLLGVLRGGLGKNEFLSYTSYKPDVAYIKLGGEPSDAREVYSFLIKPIGIITENGIEPNLAIIQPKSPVYLLEKNENPFKWIASGKEVVWMDAYIENHEEWKIPVDKAFIPYHVGVYGSTGSGKSWFTRFILIPLYIKAGYKVVILDWSGTDYASYYRNSVDSKVVKIAEIALDEMSVFSYFKNKTNNFYGNENIANVFDEFIEGWRDKVKKAFNEKNIKPAEALYKQLETYVGKAINQISRSDWRESAERAKRRIFRRFKAQDLNPIMGTSTIEEIMNEKSKVLVIDMGGALTEAKLGFFLSFSKYLYGLMEIGEDLKTALIIDEAPQYAPWEPRGIQNETTEMIKNLAALGRKRMLNLTLIAQGVKGEIGINAAVRRNLNTHFFGRIHPLDAGGEGGASEWLSPYGINPDQLLQLKPGKFYFSGAMNPSPIPLLITYNPSSLSKVV